MLNQSYSQTSYMTYEAYLSQTFLPLYWQHIDVMCNIVLYYCGNQLSSANCQDVSLRQYLAQQCPV